MRLQLEIHYFTFYHDLNFSPGLKNTFKKNPQQLLF